MQRLHGQVIRLSPTSPHYVNPMDINLNYSEDDNPLALKSDFILSLCELIVGGKEGLQPVDKTVIDRAVRNVYRPFLAAPDPAKMPILGDLYDELLKQPEPDVYKRQVLDCMRENTTKIRNIKQYLKAALFNAPSTICLLYTSRCV